MPARTLDKREEEILQGLDEPFQSRARLVFYKVNHRLEDHLDCYAVIRDGYRTPEQQWREFEKGRVYNKERGEWIVTGRVVSNAMPHQGPHCYRRAVHIVLLDNHLTEKKGDDTWLANNDQRWKWIGVAAASARVAWGGNFPKLRDMAHIEADDWKMFARSRKWVPIGPNEPRR